MTTTQHQANQWVLNLAACGPEQRVLTWSSLSALRPVGITRNTSDTVTFKGFVVSTGPVRYPYN